MLNLQALSSYFIIIPSKSCYRLTVYDKVSEFCAVHGNLRCCTRRKRKIRTLLQSETGSDFSCLVGAGGFEPPKLKSSRFTVCPHWPLGNTPIFFFLQSRGLPVYVTTESAICQPIIWAARKKYLRQSQKPSHPGTLCSVRAGGLFSLTKNQEKITSGSSCRYGAADRRCTAGSARPGSADGRSPGSPRSSGCGCCSSSSGGPSFPGWRPR